MPTPRSLNVTLSPELMDMVKAKVAAGEYASDSEVISDGLRTLEARDAEIARWLKGSVAESYDAYKADPSIGIPASQVSAALDARGDTKAAE